jgi:hypothetical protein
MRRPPGAPLDGRTPYVRKSQDGHVSVDPPADNHEVGGHWRTGIGASQGHPPGAIQDQRRTRVPGADPGQHQDTNRRLHDIAAELPSRDRSRQPSAAAPEE